MSFLDWATIQRRCKWKLRLKMMLQEELLEAGTFLVIVINLIIIMLMEG